MTHPINARDAGQFEHQLGLFDRPPDNGTITSRQAAKAIAPAAGTLRARVLGFVASQGQRGATLDEISIGLEMRLSTVCARANELKKSGQLRESSHTRPTSSGRQARVLVAARSSCPQSEVS